MKTKIEDWDESILEIEDYQVERALTNADLRAIHRARQFGTDFVIEEAQAKQPNALELNERAEKKK